MRQLPTDPLMTIPQAAEHLGMSTRYVYERIDDGSLPTVQMGTGTRSVRRIRYSTLERFIRARTTGEHE